jgi:hypothetical protein
MKTIRFQLVGLTLFLYGCWLYWYTTAGPDAGNVIAKALAYPMQAIGVGFVISALFSNLEQ